MFDRLLLIHKGHNIYFGYADLAVNYFKQKGFPMPKYINPAIYYLEKISGLSDRMLRVKFNDNYEK